MACNYPAVARSSSPIHGQERLYLQYSIQAPPPMAQATRLACCLPIPQICKELAVNSARLHYGSRQMSLHAKGPIHTIRTRSAIAKIEQQRRSNCTSRLFGYRHKTASTETMNPTAEISAGDIWLNVVRETRRTQCTTEASSTGSGTSMKTTKSACTTRGHARNRPGSTGNNRGSSEGEDSSDETDDEDASRPAQDDCELDVAPSARLFACPFYKYDAFEQVSCQMIRYERIDCVRKVGASLLLLRHLLTA